MRIELNCAERGGFAKTGRRGGGRQAGHRRTQGRRDWGRSDASADPGVDEKGGPSGTVANRTRLGALGLRRPCGHPPRRGAGAKRWLGLSASARDRRNEGGRAGNVIATKPLGDWTTHARELPRTLFAIGQPKALATAVGHFPRAGTEVVPIVRAQQEEMFDSADMLARATTPDRKGVQDFVGAGRTIVNRPPPFIGLQRVDFGSARRAPSEIAREGGLNRLVPFPTGHRYRTGGLGWEPQYELVVLQDKPAAAIVACQPSLPRGSGARPRTASWLRVIKAIQTPFA